ncbi:hypothetical protein EBZ80_11800 [bacterium]|nr:hypothetical protein [bacterium]
MPSDGPKELCEYVRKALPLRARLVGRERLDDLTLIAVTEWPIQPLMDARRGSGDEERILDSVAQSVARTYESVRGAEQRYGFLWAFVLSSAVSAIVQLVLQWWLSRPSNRMKMAAWQYSMRGGS